MLYFLNKSTRTHTRERAGALSAVDIEDTLERGQKGRECSTLR